MEKEFIVKLLSTSTGISISKKIKLNIRIMTSGAKNGVPDVSSFSHFPDSSLDFG